MKDDLHNIPIACSLSDAELRKREASLLAQFKSSVIATEELPDGFAFHIPAEGKWIIAVAELIAAERECCRFLTFELTVEPNLGPVILRITGPPDAKAFVQTYFTPASEMDSVP
ncbi:MAG TPA: hypothetical protein VHA33_07790 [Candidatus Angelobacter sp.]|jgi:hypothetical protein|nr:hypothetical protein [Candidatus Angelobacter sp.]